jgi:5-formyltetrahydrofolate cyclo-ligase
VSEKILQQKKDLRASMRAWRTGLDAHQRAHAAAAIAGHGLGFLGPPAGTAVSGFASLAEELDAVPLLRRLAVLDLRLALPVMQGKGLPLLFRAWAPGDATGKGVWGIAEPTSDKPTIEPDILLVPLLAFDAMGWRLGYGGGFYDRTLRALRARKSILAVGLAYDAQRVEAVPHLDYDEPLDWVLTPSGPLRCAS